MAIVEPASERIQAAIAQGRGPTETLRDWRERGGRIRTQSWYRVWGQVENEQLQAIPEASRPTTRRPDAQTGEVQQRTSKRPGAYHQEVVLIVQDSHGNVELRNVKLRTNRLLSRRGAVKAVRDKWNQISPERGPGQSGTVWRATGGIYFGTFELVPEE